MEFLLNFKLQKLEFQIEFAKTLHLLSGIWIRNWLQLRNGAGQLQQLY